MTFTKIFRFLKSWAINFTLITVTILSLISILVGMIWLLKTYGVVTWILFLIALAAGIMTFVIGE